MTWKNKKYLKLIEDNYDYILARMVSCDKEKEKYNGWSNSDSDKIKLHIYNSLGLKWSYDIFYRLGLEKYFGKDYTEKTFNIFTKRKDYDLSLLLFNETLDDLEVFGNVSSTLSLTTLPEIKEQIDDILELIKFRENSVYQSFYFNNTIKTVYYRGDEEDFFPKLVEDIQKIIGDKNYLYDMYEFGDRGFMLFWDISKDVYAEKMNLIKEWAEYNELGDHICCRVKNPQNKEEIVDTIGSEAVINNYYGKDIYPIEQK